jgi:serine/threonine protein kinase
MHDAGYAHRDIKLENIIFSLRDYRPILTDYGFSFQLQTATTAKRRDGTLGFMAPELLAKDATIPTKELCSTDLFSLGVVIFAVACGCMPFHYEPSETAFTLQLTTKDAWKRFWSYHHIKHNGKFRNMIEGLLTFIPEERWSIEQLKACEWLNDKTCTEKQFI